MRHLSEAHEVARRRSPAKAPQALAFGAGRLWMGSWETQRIYALKPESFAIEEEANAPGRPVGMTWTGDDLRVVCSETADDHRVIRRYAPGRGFVMPEAIPCPDDTGSFLAFDGIHLWLSQRYNQRVLEFDARYEVISEIAADAQILGALWSGGHLYLSTWHGREGGCKIARTDARSRTLEYVASMSFAAVSLAHDGARFWTNDSRDSAIVAFTLPKDPLA
ncbi:MAG TPA: hypothetical protein VMF61_15050 [Candidatus Acidoferrales bacterium]|nr:hypothetical protein [Candidatus Acidoferrales bacterium]